MYNKWGWKGVDLEVGVGRWGESFPNGRSGRSPNGRHHWAHQLFILCLGILNFVQLPFQGRWGIFIGSKLISQWLKVYWVGAIFYIMWCLLLSRDYKESPPSPELVGVLCGWWSWWWWVWGQHSWRARRLSPTSKSTAACDQNLEYEFLATVTLMRWTRRSMRSLMMLMMILGWPTHLKNWNRESLANILLMRLWRRTTVLMIIWVNSNNRSQHFSRLVDKFQKTWTDKISGNVKNVLKSSFHFGIS